MTARRVLFNAPAMTRIDTVVYPGRYDKVKDEVGDDLLNRTRSEVIARKGWLSPDTTYQEDWQDNSDTEVEDEESNNAGGAGSSNRPSARQREGRSAESDSASNSGLSQPVNMTSLFRNNEQYGFRFMYNPPEIGFSLATQTGVNVAFIMSGREKATPTVPTGSTITMNLTISRVDDMAVIQGLNPQNPEGSEADLERIKRLYDSGGRGVGEMSGGGWSIAGGRFISNSIRPSDDPSQAPLQLDILAETNVTTKQLREIGKMGTMHDLNHLFRSMTARNWKTAYRGNTADVGIMFSVPLVLDLGNPNLRYRVRLSSLNYSHRIFTPTMIPTLTEVALVFERIPDVVDWDIIPPPQEAS